MPIGRNPYIDDPMTHIPVLVDEIRANLVPDDRPITRAIDGTLGAGGHTRALLDAGVQTILAFDLDPQAIALARQTIGTDADRVHIVNDSYLPMRDHARAQGWDQVDLILLDLGLSSMQLDTPDRGFAFMHDAPLDMRFDQASPRATAGDIVNHWSAEDLADIFYKYGEERHSRRIARAIVHQRPLETTQELAQVVASAMPKGKRSKTHPATQVFQALRIAVNDELHTVETAIPIAIDLLASGGRLGVISFHSLEDRIVKTLFKDASTEIVAPPGMASIEEQAAVVDLITRKPIMPTDAEIARNPRSRSSKLRIVEKL